MNHLVSKNLIHRDLAARNVLLADGRVIKICDFGMSRNVGTKEEDYVMMTSYGVRLPLKWMSIESMFERRYSNRSDVWSFGVLLWEIFSLGCSPYSGVVLDQKFMNKLKSGTRLSKPKYANDDIYNVMLNCWQPEPNQRPSFSQLFDFFSKLLVEHADTDYLDMQCPVTDDSNFDVTGCIKKVKYPAEFFEEKENVYCNKYVEMSAINRKQTKQSCCSSQVQLYSEKKESEISSRSSYVEKQTYENASSNSDSMSATSSKSVTTLNKKLIEPTSECDFPPNYDDI